MTRTGVLGVGLALVGGVLLLAAGRAPAPVPPTAIASAASPPGTSTGAESPATISPQAAFEQGRHLFEEHRYRAAGKVFEELRRERPEWRPREVASWRLAAALRLHAMDRQASVRDSLVRLARDFVEAEATATSARVAKEVVRAIGRGGNGAWFYQQAARYWERQPVDPASTEGYLELLEAVLPRGRRGPRLDAALLDQWENLRRAGAPTDRLLEAARTLLRSGSRAWYHPWSKGGDPLARPRDRGELPEELRWSERLAREVLKLEPEAALAAQARLVLAYAAYGRGDYRQAIREAERVVRGERPGEDTDAVEHEARLLLDWIRTPRLRADGPRLYRPGSRHPLRLRWRNLREWSLRVRRVDPIEDLRPLPEGDETAARPFPYREGAGQVVLERSFTDRDEIRARRGDATAAPPLQPHVARDTTLVLDPLPVGLYVARIDGHSFDDLPVPPVRMILQVTRWGLTVTALDRGGWELWLTGMEKGRAGRGVRLRLRCRFRSPPGKKTWVTREGSVRLDRSGRGRVRLEGVPPNTRCELLVAGGDRKSPVFLEASLYGPSLLGTEPSPWRGFVISDRPLYRPGEVVHFQAFVRQADSQKREVRLPGPLPVEILVRDAAGAEVLRREGRLDANGSVQWDLSLSADPPLGRYTATVRVDSETVARGDFHVDAYRLPRFRVEVEPVGRTKPVLGDTLRIRVRAEYFFGGPVAGSGEIVVRRRRFDLIWQPRPMQDGFGSAAARPWFGGAGEEVLRTPLLLDERGEAEVELPTFDLPGDRRARFEYTVEARVRDASAREEVGRMTVRMGPEEVVARLAASPRVASPGDPVDLLLHVEDLQQRPIVLAGRWSLSRLVGPAPGGSEDGEEAEERVEPILADRPVGTGLDGEARWSVTLPGPGRYRLEFRAVDGRGRPVRARTLLWSVDPRRRLTVFGVEGLQLIAAREEFPGAQAEVLLVSQRPDVDVHLERAVAGRLQTEVVRLKGNALFLRIPLDRDHRPGFRLRATAAWDWEFHRAWAHIAAPFPERRIRLEVEFAREDHRPGETARLRLRATDLQGRPLQTPVTVAVVDAALLQLRPRVEPSLSALLQQFPEGVLPPQVDSRRAGGRHPGWFSSLSSARSPGAGVANGGTREGGPPLLGRDRRTEALASDALGRNGPTRPTLVSRDGTAGAPPTAAEAVTLRRDFRPTALWRCAVSTGDDGTAELEFTLPESLTRWKAWALVLSPDQRGGTATAETRTHKPLMVRLDHPRVFREGDRFAIRASVQSEEPVSLDVRLKLEAEGLRLVEDTAAVDLPPRGQATVSWWAEVPPDAAGAAVHRDDRSGRIVVTPRRVEMTIEAVAPAVSDALATSVEIHPWGTPLRRVASLRLADDAVGELRVPPPSSPRLDLARAVLRVSPSVLSACVDALPFLAEFPYGCTEQTLSRFVPALAVRAVAEAMGVSSTRLDPRLDEKVAEGLRRIARMQRPGGGWGWWFQDEVRPDLTAYALVALRRAERAGAPVDPRVIRRGRERLRALLPRLEGNDDDLAYALHALVFAGREEDEAMARYAADLLSSRDRLRDWSRALLASYLHRVGRDRQGRQVLALLEESGTWDPAYGTLHWGRTRGYWWRGEGAVETTAFVLQAFLALAPERKEVDAAARWLVANREGRGWRSTRETAHAIFALVDYASTRGELEPVYTLSATAAGRELLRIRVDRDHLLDAGGAWPVDPTILRDAEGRIELRLEGRGVAFVSLVVESWTSMAEPPASENWLSVERSYVRLRPIRTLGGEVLEREEALSAGDSVVVGERIRVRLRIRAHRELDYVVVEDPRPAGCEPVEALSGWVSQRGWSGRREVQDDRDVFFISRLAEGESRIQYELRAESPGVFRVPPARARGMYLPDVNGSSRAFRLRTEAGSPGP